MAKATATYCCSTCGATVHRQVDAYNRRMADERAAYLSGQGGLCEACWRVERDAKREAEHSAETMAAAALAAETGLPALVGSPKQIAWAESIRAKALAANKPVSLRPATQELADHFRITLEELVARQAEINDAAIAARRDLETETSAKWWIDNRDDLNGRVRQAQKAATERVMGR